MKIQALLTTTAMLTVFACSATSKDKSPSGPEDVEPAQPERLETVEASDAEPDIDYVEQETVYTDREAFIAPTLSTACGWDNPTVFFSTDSAKVGMVSDVKIDAVATCLSTHPLSKDPIKVTGYADERGTEDYNRKLGLERAKAIKAELVEAGIDESRITTYSRGEYVVDGDDSFLDDRRVLIELDK